jgi:hypothetical protein
VALALTRTHKHSCSFNGGKPKYRFDYDFVVKTRRKSRRKTNRKKLILPISVVIIIVVIAVAVYISNPLSAGRNPLPAQDYFTIENSTVDTSDFPESYPNLIIYELSFTLRAVGGDATGLVVGSIANSDLKDLGDLAKGESVFVNIQTGSFGYMTRFNEEYQGFRVEIPITCYEAEGKVVFYIPL